MSVDTAGSQIDTLIGVYTKDGSDFIEVGCIDDVFTLPLGTTYQAAITIDTEIGTTYYVEIGGYRESGPFGERSRWTTGRSASRCADERSGAVRRTRPLVACPGRRRRVR